MPPSDKVQGTLVMAGPVYKGVDNTNRFSHIPDKADIDHVVSGPVYPANPLHKYNPYEPKKEAPQGMIGPVYDVLHEHHFREVLPP